jgi:hypothetical protein
VDLIHATGLMSENSDQFKGSMTTTLALGCWSLGAQNFSSRPSVINNVTLTPMVEQPQQLFF